MLPVFLTAASEARRGLFESGKPNKRYRIDLAFVF
jgi:hypothetical protein